MPADVGPATTCPCCTGTDTRVWLRTRPFSSPERGCAPSYTLLRCTACSHIWLFPPPSPDELSHFYNDIYHQAVTRSGEGERDPARWSRQIAAIRQYKSQGALLDLGCSSGGFLSCLNDGAWQLAGVEASPEAAQRARQITGGAIVTGDIATVELPSDAFDVITCSDVLEHLQDPRAIFQNVARWLRPGGIFYVFVPNIGSWEARLFQSFWYPLDLPRHLHFFSPASLDAFAGSAGLRTLRIATPPGNYIEHSESRILTWLARKATRKEVWIEIGGPTNIVARIIRKAFRVTLEEGFAQAAALFHAGPSFQAVFQRLE